MTYQLNIVRIRAQMCPVNGHKRLDDSIYDPKAHETEKNIPYMVRLCTKKPLKPKKPKNLKT